MTKKDVPAMLRRIGIPMAYDHFAEGESPKPPFCVYLYPRSDNFAADGKVYYKQDVLFDEYGLFYAKSEVWIQSERLYEVLYKMEV